MQLAKVVSIEDVGEGTRVCLDFVDVFDADEGVLVGNTGHGYLLLLAECQATETYPPRPFRVNAGAIHHYLLMNGDKTCYLSDIRPGMKVPVWKSDGSFRMVAVGRVKVERRPLARISLGVEGEQVSATVQQSDSIRLSGPNGAIQMVHLKPSDEARIRLDQPGRHIGKRIQEYIKEL